MLGDYFICRIIMALFIIYCAFEDYMHKSVDIRAFYSIYIFELISYIIIRAMKKDIYYREIILGISLGIVLWLLARIYRFIGEGDALFFIASGAFFGIRGSMQLFIYTVLLLFISSAYILLSELSTKRFRKNRSLAMLVYTMPVAIYMLFAC